MPPSLTPEMKAGASGQVGELIRAAGRLADSFRFDNADDSGATFPAREMVYLTQEGILQAALPLNRGGAGMGVEAGSHIHLLHLLKEIGRANLSLGRVYEGHVNALQLIHAYGNAEQQASAVVDCLSGKLFAVWNTDSPDPVCLSSDGEGSWRLNGSKAFASAAGWADRPLVTAERVSAGRQMCLLKKEEMTAEIDFSSWHPVGMEASGSYEINLSGTRVPESALIGRAGEYYAPPLFLGGSIRTSAVLLGGVEALFQHLRSYLRCFRQTLRPLQQFRMARIYAALGSGRGWLQYAAAAAEVALYAHADASAAQRMNFAANATRVAIEDICPQVIRFVSESVGARGLMPPFRFGPIIKDLTMFLRQPNPDECLLEAGRYLLESEDPNV
jgi:alkylation response protein AidB-like acyl-CoA dehydrogenase